METMRKNDFQRYNFKDKKDVLKVALDPANKIEFIRIIFPDILGRHLDFSIPNYELEKTFDQGKGFDGSSVEGFVRIEESDLTIVPDPTTFRVLPWEYEGFQPGSTWREAIMFGDIFTPEGKHYEGDTRHILKRVLERGRNEFGIEDIKVGPELEFFIFPNNREPKPLDEGGYFFSGRHGEIRKEIQLLLKEMGIKSEYDHHEVAHGQHEIDFRFLSAIEMADTCMIFRYLVKKVLRMHGLYATFMPKPLNGQNGNGMHVHQSLWRRGKNLFFDRRNGYHLAEIAQHYMAGLMVHAREISPVLNQWINSYKRLIEGYEAPVYIAWGQKNRSAYIRVPEYQPGKEQATRIELRSPDPACNLYLALTAIFTAGLTGIKEQYRLPTPIEENIYTMSATKQKEHKIKTLPSNLEEGLKIMQRSTMLKEALGVHVFKTFVANKRWEIEEYHKAVSREFDQRVSPYEIERYLPVL